MTKLNNTIKNYFDSEFTQLALQNNLFEKLVFEQCQFAHCDFSNSQLIHCKFIDCTFSHCNLSALIIDHSVFSQVTFNDSKMIGINWAMAKWPQIKLGSPIHFYQCNISFSSFYALSLAAITIDSCKAHEVDFREGDLSHASLVASDFYKSLFIHTNLSFSDFTGAVNYCIGIHLNKIQQAKFSFPEVVGLLTSLDIKISGLE